MVTTLSNVPAAISTGNVEIDKKVGGGIPTSSLTLIEGQSDAGKSVVAQHLTFGALIGGVGVVYYTAENTVKSLLSQMASLNLDVTDYFLLDRLRIYPIHISAARLSSAAVFGRLVSHFAILPAGFKVIVIDSVTNIITHSQESNVIDFFITCKELCDEGRTIICHRLLHNLQGAM